MEQVSSAHIRKFDPLLVNSKIARIRCYTIQSTPFECWCVKVAVQTIPVATSISAKSCVSSFSLALISN